MRQCTAVALGFAAPGLIHVSCAWITYTYDGSPSHPAASVHALPPYVVEVTRIEHPQMWARPTSYEEHATHRAPDEHLELAAQLRIGPPFDCVGANRSGASAAGSLFIPPLQLVD